MKAPIRCLTVVVLALAAGACSDPERVLLAPDAPRFGRMANPAIAQTLVNEINAAIVCLYSQDPQLLSRKLSEFERIVALNSRTVAQAQAVRAQVNNFIRDSERAIGSLTSACDGKSVAVASQELNNALYLLSDQPENIETPEYEEEAAVAVFIPGDELEFRTEGAAVNVPADAFDVPVLLTIRKITELTFDPAAFETVGEPIVPPFEFSVQPDIPANGDGWGRYICVSHDETDLGTLQLYRQTGPATVVAIPDDDSNILCGEEHYAQRITNPVLRGAVRLAASITQPFRPRLLYALQHRAIGGPDILASPHMVVRVANTEPATTFCPNGPVGTYASLQSAVDATAPGGTVYVCNGTYEVDSVVISKPLTIRSENPGGATLSDDAARQGGVQGGVPALIIRGVTSGTVRIADINFAVVRSALLIGNQSSEEVPWDQVVLDSVSIAGLDPLNTFVVRSFPSSVPGAKLEVRHSTFQDLFLGVFAISGEVNVRNSTFTNTDRGIVYSFPGSLTIGPGPVGAATGTAENNIFNTCGSGGCIRGLGRGGYVIKGNTVNVPTGSARFGGIVVQLSTDAPGLAVGIEDNVVAGARIPSTPADPQGWTIMRGITINTHPGMSGSFVVTALRNQVSGAWAGLHFNMHASAGVAAHDNVVTASGQAFSATGGGSSVVYTRNDAGIMEIGSFGAPEVGGPRDYTCNWWGSTSGPTNISPLIPPSTYTPWAMQPIAGNPGVSCP